MGRLLSISKQIKFYNLIMDGQHNNSMDVRAKQRLSYRVFR
jgi:hypothetical protein